jgi:hypothetical protein
MTRPTLEVADILRAWAGRFLEHSRARRPHKPRLAEYIRFSAFHSPGSRSARAAFAACDFANAEKWLMAAKRQESWDARQQGVKPPWLQVFSSGGWKKEPLLARI